ncbi:MAG: hypothetical protein LBL43_04065 [Treponema sp.]|nr:hypothetical protein [Treponema sp.]
MKKPFPKWAVFLLSFLFVILLGALWFFSRPPVLLLTDMTFEVLYGRDRGRGERLAASLGLFRRIVPVPIAESAGPEVILLAAEEAAAAPHCVLFPYRFLEGGRRYREQHPEIPALVLGGRVRDIHEGTVYTNTQFDMYRAGAAAALIAGDNPGAVLVFTDGWTGESDRRAFQTGLRDQGSAGTPLYLNGGQEEYNFDQEIACAVIAGPAPVYFDLNLKAPLILFSWANPAQTPWMVKVIFDDSPWGVLKEAVGRAVGGGEGDIPSKMLILQDRLGDLAGVLRKKVPGDPLFLGSPGGIQ